MISKKPAIGTLISLDLPQVAMQLPSLGFDFLFIDLEHGQVSDTTISSIIAARKNDCTILIRIAHIHETTIKHALDLGCDGIIAPRVERIEQVHTLTQFSYYPPEGHRGVAFCPANRYGQHFEEYTQSFKPILLAQIESSAGLAIAPSIVAEEKMSGLFLGPYDLSMSMGIPGQFDHPTFLASVATVRKLASSHNKLFGTFISNLQGIQQEVNSGTDLITVGVDSHMMLSMYQQILGEKENMVK